MIIKLIIENFLSYKNKTEFNLSTKMSSENNAIFSKIIDNKEIHFQKTTAIYGANASGKSNLLKSLSFIQNLFSRTSTEQKIKFPEIYTRNFKLSTTTQDKPSHFELHLVVDNEVFIYTVKLCPTEITEESLIKEKHKVNYFQRSGKNIKAGNSIKNHYNQQLESNLREDELLLKKLAQNNHATARKIIKIIEDVTFINKYNASERFGFADEKYTTDKNYKKIMDDFILGSDLGLKGINITRRKVSVDQIEKDFKNHPLKEFLLSQENLTGYQSSRYTVHNVFDNGKQVGEKEMSFDAAASDGTRNMYALSAFFAKALLEKDGGLVVIDELGGTLHPTICKMIIEKFNSPATNKNNARILFTTHDTSLMTPSLLTKDQIYFVEKNRLNESEIYSLKDVEKKRGKDISYAKRYLEGRYGAIPTVE